jgi:hypothetical protein
MLRASLSSPYPASNEKGQPLEFQLEVVESPPNSAQLSTIMSYLPSKAADPSMVFLSAHPSATNIAEQPTTLKGIAALAETNPNAFKWPVVVDWVDGKASIGNPEGVKEILESIRKKRDGETKEDDVYRPGWFI